MRAIPVFALILLLLPGCGGGGGSSSAAPAAPAAATTVLVVPAGPTLQPGQTQPFSATVNGSASTAVSWSVVETGGGSITTGGWYTAPTTTGTYHVQAQVSAGGTGQAIVHVAAAVAGTPSLGIGAPLNGYLPFPADNPWNQDISGLPVDPSSDAVIALVGAGVSLHPDFGSGLWEGAPIGIPYAVVAGGQTRITVNYQAYGDQSDPGPMPIPSPPPFEGIAPTDTNGDRHVLVMDRDAQFLYELYAAQLQPDGSWNADSGAIWDLTADTLRPWGWTSADAAGLPIFAGLARYDEVAAGAIRHALRLTVPDTRAAFLLPATHFASSDTRAAAPPMGARFRLKSSYDISGFTPQAQVVLQALKTYGMILADNGSAWYLSGCPDPGWDNDDLHNLGQVTGADLELVQMGTVYTQVPTGTGPAIQSFTASPATVAAGASATLAWTSSGADRAFLNPGPGPVRGASLVVTPTTTTTYTLQVEGPFGSCTATVTVSVAP